MKQSDKASDVRRLNRLCLAFGAFLAAGELYKQCFLYYFSPYYRMGQMVFRDIASRWGNGIGIVSYIGGMCLGGGLLHGMWYLLDPARKRKTCGTADRFF